MLRILLLLICMCLSGCSTVQPPFDFTLGDPHSNALDELDRMPSYKDCPACYAQESPLEKQINRVGDDVEAVTRVVMLPFLPVMGVAYFILSGGQLPI